VSVVVVAFGGGDGVVIWRATEKAKKQNTKQKLTPEKTRFPSFSRPSLAKKKIDSIKSKDNRDKRVELLQEYAAKFFPSTKYLQYAVRVEEYTLTKAANLVLNVDGCIGALFLDLLASSGAFSPREADDVVAVGYLNGLFVFARSIGLIGHALDQKRLQQPLYRHPWEEVLYADIPF
jgi:hypothetical protein